MQEKLSEVILILVGSTLIVLMLIMLVIFSLFINQKRKFRHQKEIADMKNSYTQELLRSQLEIQTQTFQTISRELHDNVGTLVSIALVHIKSMEESNQAKDQQKITEINNLLNEAMDTLRDISRSINPENIYRNGWQQSFKAELGKLAKTNLFAIHYSEEGEPFSIEPQKQIILFRILQESLNNIVKHSEACHVRAQIVFSPPGLTVLIKDDGKGFDYGGDHRLINGSGLKNMQARAAMLPADLEVESQPGSGTSIKISYKEPITNL